jgi:hypothetical protein
MGFYRLPLTCLHLRFLKHKQTVINNIYDYLNDGEYCIGFGQWAQLCKKAGFKKVKVSPLKGFAWFKVLAARK